MIKEQQAKPDALLVHLKHIVTPTLGRQHILQRKHHAPQAQMLADQSSTAPARLPFCLRRPSWL
jgi:hypothetical protein